MSRSFNMSRYTATDGHVASTEDKAILDYVAKRFGNYQLRLSFDDDGTAEYHLCTRCACVEFNSLASLKEFLGEQLRH
jgi:hypothetical protein